MRMNEIEKLPRQWNRPLQTVEPTPHIVAFIDILGYKDLLRAGKLNHIVALFEELADATYGTYRANNLWGHASFQPTLVNFSDSIILYSRFFDEAERPNLHRTSLQNFFDLCMRLVATALRFHIPVRGAIAVGPFYHGVAKSVLPDSVSRWGGPASYLPLLHEIEAEFGPVTIDDDWEHRVLPPVQFSLHSGTALVDAYQLQEGLPSIGVFLHESASCFQTVAFYTQIERLVRFSVANREMLAVNWRKCYDDEIHDEIDAFISSQAKNPDERIAAKWRSLLRFRNLAPSR